MGETPMSDTMPMIEDLDAVTDRINADSDHAARVTAALGELVDATARIAEAADEQGQDAALVGFVRTTVELRERLVAGHGEDAGVLAWRDALALVSWRASAQGAAS